MVQGFAHQGGQADKWLPKVSVRLSMENRSPGQMVTKSVRPILHGKPFARTNGHQKCPSDSPWKTVRPEKWSPKVSVRFSMENRSPHEHPGGPGPLIRGPLTRSGPPCAPPWPLRGLKELNKSFTLNLTDPCTKTLCIGSSHTRSGNTTKQRAPGPLISRPVWLGAGGP